MTTRLLLDERILGDGRMARAWAILVGESLRLEDDDGISAALPIAVLDHVMARYGRELDPALVLDGDVLEVPGGRRLQRLRHHAPVDAIARDYLVWQRDGEPPIAALATHVTAALRFVARGGVE